MSVVVGRRSKRSKGRRGGVGPKDKERKEVRTRELEGHPSSERTRPPYFPPGRSKSPIVSSLPAGQGRGLCASTAGASDQRSPPTERGSSDLFSVLSETGVYVQGPRVPLSHADPPPPSRRGLRRRRGRSPESLCVSNPQGSPESRLHARTPFSSKSPRRGGLGHRSFHTERQRIEKEPRTSKGLGHRSDKEDDTPMTQ